MKPRHPLDGFDEDMRDHIERETQENVERGLAPEEARRRAMLRFGNVALAREDTRAVWIQRWAERLIQDVRYTLRTLRKAPAFTLAAVGTLALGVGATTAMFTVVNGVLLRPLPYSQADRVVSVWTRYLPESGYDFPEFNLSGPELVDYRAQTRALADVAGFVIGGTILRTGDEPRPVNLARATANLFTTLGVQAAIGRGFLAGEDQPGAACVAVLSHGLWVDAFGGDPEAVGSVVQMGGAPCEVVGVMPAGFAFPGWFPDAEPRLWRNFIVDPASPLWDRGSHNLLAVGRLAAGATFADAEAEARALMAGWREAFPDHYTGHFVFLRPFLDDVVGDVRAPLVTLLAAVGVVLLIVCANLGSLLLARGESRRRELGVRLALGAARQRVAAQVFTESLALALAGGVLGVAAAALLTDGLLALYPGPLPRGEAITLDWRVVGFAAAMTGLTALLFGVAPALRAASASPGEALRTGGRSVAGHAGGARLMRGLVVAELALGVMLVIGAGLLARSYGKLLGVDLGMDTQDVYVLSLALPGATYPDTASVGVFYQPLVERIAALPGVESAGAVSSLPIFSGVGARDDFVIEGRPEPPPGQPAWNAGYVMATPGYFETLRIPVRSGRVFQPSDHRDAPWVAVINEATARRYWPGENPIGRRLRYRSAGDPEPAPQWITVVGLVGDTRADGAREEPAPQIFVPHAQTPRAAYQGRFMTLVVRAAEDPLALAPALRAVVREADPGLPLIQNRLLDGVVRDSVGQPRFTSLLVTGFAAVALLLGALGIHGVLAYWVALRSRELGVRLALGASPAAVLRLVLGQGVRLTLLGIGLGLTAALGLTRLIRGLLFGVGATDPLSFGVAVAVLGAAALIACYGPGRRAARIDPVVALRVE